MIDVNKPVREAFVAVLDGAIEVDGVPVPVLHERDPFDNGVYIILHTQTGENRSNKGANEVTGTLMVDVIHLTDGSTFDVVDTVVNSVKALLEPGVRIHGLTNPAGLQIWSLVWLSDTDIPLFSSEGNVMRRAMRYEYKVNIL